MCVCVMRCGWGGGGCSVYGSSRVGFMKKIQEFLDLLLITINLGVLSHSPYIILLFNCC